MAQPRQSPAQQLLRLMETVRFDPLKPGHLRQSDLARELGITPTSVGRYFKQLDEGTIDDRVWAQIADLLLRRFSLDVSKIRPVRQPMSIDTSLTPYLDAFSTPQQLEALAHILEGADKQQARDLLLVLVRDRLAHR